ncbi:MAG TPA: response regulator [Ohtaekwangia sp.]|uniref:response regulator n=1 Tax=Ohtaekwangia sp. TaxID=2066019 RepID=UPI002F94AC89
MNTILLVDDSDTCIFLHRKIIKLASPSAVVHTAGNGEEALQFLEQHQHDLPQIIFLDLNMPVMNGFKFIEALQSRSFPGKENITIIVVSSSEDSEDIRQSRQLGIQHYMVKPLTVAKLKAMAPAIHLPLG